VPLAAGYLKLLARRRGLENAFAIEILPAQVTNDSSDQGLAAAILARDPWLVGFTCYLWNIERTLWVAQRLKEFRPDVRIVLGGPEITADNAWVLGHPAVDYAVFGEGEQTFVEFLERLARSGNGRQTPADLPLQPDPIPGLWSRSTPAPPRRSPLTNLDEISSPYLEGILDAADERTMFLETVRGCVYKCKFCYYPKSYDALYFVSREKIEANLRHAVERGVTEIVLLDPTLNQRRDFDDFLRLLARHNAGRQFACFGELRGEGIHERNAPLLREANFSEVEIGLQSLDPHAQDLMDRRVNLRAFERGARAMLDVGIDVRVDLILGLPGDTPDSVRRGIDYLHGSGLYTSVQVFNLSILPGTAFRHEAAALGLRYQPRPPYYVLGTPTLSIEQMVDLMQEAQEAFGLEFDPFPPPVLEFDEAATPARVARIDLDRPEPTLPAADHRALAFTLWLRADDFDARRVEAAALVRQVLLDNPHTTLQVVLEPSGTFTRLSIRTLEALQEACYPSTSYLDQFYSLHPNPLLRAKRLVALLPAQDRERLGLDWVDEAGQYATIVWRGFVPEEDLASYEYVVNPGT
jgi:radical SAM superfamily enzyme YgiQ (UPF0313 family)